MQLIKRGNMTILPEQWARGVGKRNRLETAPTGDEPKRPRKAKKRKRIKV
jgi:hypothetical protein